MAAVILLMSFLAIDPTPFSEPKDPVLSCSWLFVGNQVTHLRRPPPYTTTSSRLESSWIDIVIRIDRFATTEYPTAFEPGERR